ncbi:MAG: flagellar basal body protein [Candidatus Melainabacteria bacterium]|nr:flagellar basal body protein [Candidatus Melainabacteria bacterium]
MTGTFGGLGISTSGMQAAQAGLNVASNNIANVNTPGYSRQRINFKQGDTTNLPGVNVMRTFSGVVIEDIERIRDLFLDQSYREQASNKGFDEKFAELMISMNNILGEPSETGLTAKMTDFFKAAKDFAASPDSSTARSIFVNSADALADAFNQIDSSISLLKRNLDLETSGQIDGAVTELNTVLEELGEVHAQVLKSYANAVPSTELEDRRDLLIDRAMQLYNFDVNTEVNGQFRNMTTTLYSSDAKVTATNAFPNIEDAIAGITTSANTLTLSVDNGAGTATGPFTVNFEAGSSMRDVVTKINNTFKASGGLGTIASLSDDGYLVISTALIENAVNDADAEIDITGGSALTVLGLTAATTNGADGTTVTVLNNQGRQYLFDVEKGNNILDSNPATLILRSIDGLLTRQGSLDNVKGEIGGMLEATNKDIPEMRKMLDNLAMSIKTSVNDLLQLGTTQTGNTGSALFTGNAAGTFSVITGVMSNPELIAPGKTQNLGDGSIVDEVANLFFDSNNIVSDNAKTQMVYIDSTDTGNVQSLVPLVPGQEITIHADGIVLNNSSNAASLVNAGTNGFGSDSLVQYEFLDSSGTVIGSTGNFTTAAGAPESRVSYSGTIPASAAFVRFKMNASFDDASLSNNQGHFKISVIQGGVNDSSSNLSNKMTDIVGSYGTAANVAISKAENSGALLSSLDNDRIATSGVSLEEDAAELIRFQTAFAANANVMRVYNEVLESMLSIV